MIPARHFPLLVLACALGVAGTPIHELRAQVDESVPATTSTSTPTAPIENPYTIEALPNDEVYGDFVLGPGKVELVIPPGESRTVELQLSNRIGEDKVFDVEVEDVSGSSDPNQTVVLLGDDTGPYTLKDYISIPQPQFTLAHGQRAIIPVTITIPPDAEPGGHYGSVLVKTVTREAEAGDLSSGTAPASAVISRIGALFFIKIPGDVEEAGAVQEFSTWQDQRWFDSGPVKFNVTFQNTGSVHLNPYGEIRITNMLGEEVGFVELEPWFVLPQSIRLREITWNRDWLYGRYQATLKLNRGYDDVVDEAVVTFWVIPWQIAAAVFAALFIIFFILRAFFRTFEFKRKDR